MSNFAEGFAQRGDNEFKQFFSIALGSAGEVRIQLYAALDLGYIAKKEFQGAYDAALETGKLIAGFIQYLNTG
jgi:four helix bundle protein